MSESIAGGPGGEGLPKRADHQAPKRARNRVLRGILEVVGILVAAVLLSTFIRFFVVQLYTIPSGSMMNTLQVGDRIAVNRLPYFGKTVERGDVIVFADENHWLAESSEDSTFWERIGQFMGIFPANGEEVLVKRVIGVGGDTVECCTSDGKLTVNGIPISEPYLIDPSLASDTEFAVVVPEGTYWVMGDNRSGSADSRYHLTQGDAAFIPEEAVIGKTWGIVLPFNRWGGVTGREPFAGIP